MEIDSEPLANSADLVCPKCKMFGCDCNRPADKATPLIDLCPACRRSRIRCICTSHVLHIPFRGAEDEEQHEGQPVMLKPRERVEATVRHVMRCYYDTRDPAEIERVVRELANRAFIA